MWPPRLYLTRTEYGNILYWNRKDILLGKGEIVIVVLKMKLMMMLINGDDNTTIQTTNNICNEVE